MAPPDLEHTGALFLDLDGTLLEIAATPDATLYGGLAAVVSYTWGVDVFDAGNTGAVTLENAYGGVRFSATPDMSFDFLA